MLDKVNTYVHTYDGPHTYALAAVIAYFPREGVSYSRCTHLRTASHTGYMHIHPRIVLDIEEGGTLFPPIGGQEGLRAQGPTSILAYPSERPRAVLPSGSTLPRKLTLIIVPHPTDLIPHTLCCRHTLSQRLLSPSITAVDLVLPAVHSRRIDERRSPKTRCLLHPTQLARISIEPLTPAPPVPVRIRVCPFIYLPAYLSARDGTRPRRAIGPEALSGLRFCCASCAGIASG